MNSGRRRSTSVELGPSELQLRPKSVKFSQNWTGFERCLAKIGQLGSARHRPNLAKSGPSSTDVAPILTIFEQTRPGDGRLWVSAKLGPNSGDLSAKLWGLTVANIGPKSTELGPNSTELGPNSAELGPSMAMSILDRFLSNLANLCKFSSSAYRGNSDRFPTDFLRHQETAPGNSVEVRPASSPNRAKCVLVSTKFSQS